MIKSKDITIIWPYIPYACNPLNLIHQLCSSLSKIFKYRNSSSFQFFLLLEKLLFWPVTNKLCNDRTMYWLSLFRLLFRSETMRFSNLVQFELNTELLRCSIQYNIVSIFLRFFRYTSNDKTRPPVILLHIIDSQINFSSELCYFVQ